MRALITGHSGFTGRYVTAELERNGYEVFGIGTHPAAGDGRYRQADLLDADSLQRCVAQVRPQVVVHLAAVAFVAHSRADAFYQVNVIGTRNLLAALATVADSLECAILASSANIYGNATAGMLTESTPPNPANDYAVSKLAMEYMANLWRDRLPLIIARPFNYTGVGQSDSFLLPKIVAHFRRRAPAIELGNLEVWRDFSDVRAVAEAYRRLLDAKPAGQVVNICSGRTCSLRDVIAMAQDITGHRIEVATNPAFVRANEVRSLSGDPSRLRDLIGAWENPPLEDTLRWMLTAE